MGPWPRRLRVCVPDLKFSQFSEQITDLCNVSLSALKHSGRQLDMCGSTWCPDSGVRAELLSWLRSCLPVHQPACWTTRDWTVFGRLLLTKVGAVFPTSTPSEWCLFKFVIYAHSIMVLHLGGVANTQDLQGKLYCMPRDLVTALPALINHTSIAFVVLSEPRPLTLRT